MNADQLARRLRVDRTQAIAPATLQASIVGIVYPMVQTVAQNAWNKYRSNREWKLVISGDDELYFEMHQWLVEHADAKSRKSLAARTHYQPDPNRQGPPIPHVRFLVDDDSTQVVEIDGQKVSVYVDDENGGGPRNPDSVQSMQMLKPPKLVFSSMGRAGRDAAVRLVEEIREERNRERRRPGLMVLDKWGDWNRRNDLPGRPLESVITEGNVLEELLQDIATFKRQESDYVDRAIPYHRAYLLVGPPGTGKTSAVKAVANSLELDLWYGQLSGIDKDAKLADILGEVRAQGVLLLEDIDSLPAAIDRTSDDADSTGDISTSGLLNALDGVATPHGLITIMTTNHPEKLDSALMRPGRIDRVVEFFHPERDTMVRHFEFFYGRPPELSENWTVGRSSAAISEIFKQRMHDPDAADVKLCQEITEDDEKWEASGALGAGFPVTTP